MKATNWNGRVVILTQGMTQATGGRIYGVFADESDARAEDADARAIDILGEDQLTTEQIELAERNSEEITPWDYRDAIMEARYRELVETLNSDELAMAITDAPEGTSGLVIEPWSRGEVYGVAADWTQAASSVWCYGDGEWVRDAQGRQVADFRHRPIEALISELRQALIMGGDDEDEAEAIAADAIEF